MEGKGITFTPNLVKNKGSAVVLAGVSKDAYKYGALCKPGQYLLRQSLVLDSLDTAKIEEIKQQVLADQLNSEWSLVLQYNYDLTASNPLKDVVHLIQCHDTPPELFKGLMKDAVTHRCRLIDPDNYMIGTDNYFKPRYNTDIAGVIYYLGTPEAGSATVTETTTADLSSFNSNYFY